MIIIGVNGGGTKTEAVCYDEKGKLLGKGSAGPSSYHNIGLEAAMKNVSLAVAATGYPKPDKICVALASINSEKDYTILNTALKKIHKNVILEHDAYAEVYTQTRGKPGIMVIAGTGSIVMGFDGKERHRRCDMGWFLGDTGSGHFIGREALIAAAKMIFEEGEYTSLAQEITLQLGLDSPQDLMAWTYSDKRTVTVVASLTKAVDKAASKGDKVAISIIKTASANLANSSVEMAKKLKLKEVCIKDGVFNMKMYLSNFTQILAKNGVSVKHIEGSAAMGAMLIAADSAGIKLKL